MTFWSCPADWTAADLAAFAPEFTPDFARLLAPREGMKSREIAGGTGPGSVATALRQAGETTIASVTDYLVGTPLLGDYLEEGAAALDLSLEDFERG